jgi:hypothetical protein
MKVSLFCFVLPWAVSSDKFLGRKMDSASIRAELKGVLDEVLGQGHGVDEARLQRIRKILAPMWTALPKNQKGNVAVQVMRYTVRRYFSARHAWIVKGFEPHADIVNLSSDEEVDIFQGKIPDYIRTVLEDKFRHDGFGFEDTVSMVAAVERLAFDEVVRSVELAFYLNNLPLTVKMSKVQLMDIMSSYLITEMLEGTDNREQHQLDKDHILERYPNWDQTFQFLVDVVSSDIWQRRYAGSPFSQDQNFGFDDAIRLAELISEQFGPWSNHECQEMRSMLTHYDVHHTGRVRMADFYQSTAEGAWQFLEPTQFLRQNGALDESSSYLGPQVIIANYISSMSNCITSAPYYSICCLNDCDQVFQHLENVIAAPTSTASQIIEVLENMPQGPTIKQELSTWLGEISALHNGQVPLHGRLLAQWLHFVFPHECPYPHMGGLAPKTQEQWREQVGEAAESVTEEEVRMHLEAESSRVAASPHAGKGMWELKESLMESSTPSDLGGLVPRALRLLAQLGMIGGFAFLCVKEIGKMVPLTKVLFQPAKSIEHNV